MRLEKLPGFIAFDAEQERIETERLRRMRPDERLAMVAALCRAGAKLLSINDKRDEILAYRESLPESTVKALARLRRKYSVTPS